MQPTQKFPIFKVKVGFMANNSVDEYREGFLIFDSERKGPLNLALNGSEIYIPEWDAETVSLQKEMGNQIGFTGADYVILSNLEPNIWQSESNRFSIKNPSMCRYNREIEDFEETPFYGVIDILDVKPTKEELLDLFQSVGAVEKTDDGYVYGTLCTDYYPEFVAVTVVPNYLESLGIENLDTDE